MTFACLIRSVIATTASDSHCHHKAESVTTVPNCDTPGLVAESRITWARKFRGKTTGIWENFGKRKPLILIYLKRILDHEQ